MNLIVVCVVIHSLKKGFFSGSHLLPKGLEKYESKVIAPT